MLAVRLSKARVKTAKAVHRKHLQVTFLDQNVEASSQENMTPPMGEPKAAAKPAAAPAEMISRWSASFCNTICSQNVSTESFEVLLSDFIFPFFLDLLAGKKQQQPGVDDSQQPQ